MGEEKVLWGYIRKAAPKDEVDLHRIENRVSTGMPDVFARSKLTGRCSWIELKVVKFGVKIPLRPAQDVWLTDYSSTGGNCYVVAHIVDQKIIALWDGSTARDLCKGWIEPRLTFPWSPSGIRDLLRVIH